MPLELTDAELIELCLQGDNAGFDILVKRYQKQILGFCYRILGDRELAADASQQTFVKAYHALGTFRRDASFLSWLFKIASNTCIDMKRKLSRCNADSLDASPKEAHRLTSNDPCPEKRVLEDEDNRLIREAIMELPIRCRVSLVLFYYHNMKLREIAESLGKPIGTVKSDIHTARNLLRSKLKGVIVEI